MYLVSHRKIKFIYDFLSAENIIYGTEMESIMPDIYDELLEELKSGAYICGPEPERQRAALIKECEDGKLFAESMQRMEEEMYEEMEKESKASKNI